MGRLAGVRRSSNQAWQNIETGNRRIPIDMALALCASTGLTLSWIYQGVFESLPPDLQDKVKVQIRKRELERRRPTA